MEGGLRLSVSSLLLVLALVSFVVDALWLVNPRVKMFSIGCAFLVAFLLVR